MGRNKDIKRKLHSPPSICRACGEPHYLGLEHVCITAETTYEGLIPKTNFILTQHHPVRVHTSNNWVQAARLLVGWGLGSQKQVFEDLGKAKEKTDAGPQQL